MKRLVAVVRGEIAADGALELADHGWGEDVGEIRLIIARPYQRKGLGLLMAGALYELAAASGVKEIVVRMMRPQKAARGIFRKLGFREEVLLPDYAKDRTGKRQDVILGRCDLEALWTELEHYMGDSATSRDIPGRGQLPSGLDIANGTLSTAPQTRFHMTSTAPPAYAYFVCFSRKPSIFSIRAICFRSSEKAWPSPSMIWIS